MTVKATPRWIEYAGPDASKIGRSGWGRFLHPNPALRRLTVSNSAAMYFGIVALNYSTNNFNPTLLKELGYTSAAAQVSSGKCSKSSIDDPRSTPFHCTLSPVPSVLQVVTFRHMSTTGSGFCNLACYSAALASSYFLRKRRLR